jgi:hypothetical protein
MGLYRKKRVPLFPVIARREATEQSIFPAKTLKKMDCFAALAMTSGT